MTLPFLPDDCIYYMLKYLQNHRSTLFNYLLVNRFWCQTTIPLLYANPFDSLTTSTNKKSHLIILTLILCLNKNEILQFKNQLKLIDNDIDVKYDPVFEYPKYIERYDYYEIHPIIINWFKIYLNQLYDFPMIQIIHQSILLQCNNIKQLYIPQYLTYDEKNRNFQTFTSNLSKLNLLSLNELGNDNINETGLEFLSNIENICLNLRELKLDGAPVDTTITNTTKEKLCTIIQKQNNLKVFAIARCKFLLNDILLSLESQKHSLVSIEFEKVNFSNVSFKNFINLCNLKFLKFHKCKEISLDQCKIFKFATFKLKELSCQYNHWNNVIETSMIKYFGIPLQRLTLLTNKSILENILVYCSNLTTLEIIFGFVNLLVPPYFKNLKISRLIIEFTIVDHITKLASNIPLSVKEVSFRFNSSLYCLYLKKFLENCHDLEVINLDSILIGLEFLKVILNYAGRNNNLKILGIMVLDKKWSDDETNLLDKIKEKGVKLVKSIVYEF